MAKKKHNSKRDADWAEAKRLCRLSAADVCKAKELGLNPRKLIKNRPNPSERWKQPVHLWIRELYARKEQKKARKQTEQAEPPSAPPPPPSFDTEEVGEDLEQVELPTLPMQPAAATDEHAHRDQDFAWELFNDIPENPLPWQPPRPPDSAEIAAQNEDMWRRQRQFRLAAEFVARAFAEIPEVQKVVLFGSVAVPLKTEVPRFREYRRAGIAIAHECKDVDLAVWLTDLGNLRALGKARGRAVNELLAATGIGVAHHQMDVFVMEPSTDRYLGRLCLFGTCPKQGKRECQVPACGAMPFLQQHEGFTLRADALRPDRTVVLFERATGMRASEDEEIPF